jgi:hypothetical protein
MIDLSGAWRLSKIPDLLLTHNDTLTYLDLSDTRIDGDMRLLGKLTTLQQLHLRGIKRLWPPSLPQLLDYTCKTLTLLTVLDLSANRFAVSYHDNTQDLSISDSVLQVLKINNCRMVGDIGRVIDRSSNLESLDISASDLQPAQLAYIMAGCPSLQYLNVSQCPHLDGDHLFIRRQHIEEGRVKPLLELRCSQVGNVSVEDCRQLLECSCVGEHLETLDMSCTGFFNSDILRHLPHYLGCSSRRSTISQLREISLREGIFEADALEAAAHGGLFTHVTTLDLSHVSSLGRKSNATITALKAVFTSCSSSDIGGLKNMLLDGCYLGQHVLTELCTRPPSSSSSSSSVTSLSVIGCRGLCDDDFIECSMCMPSLVDLSVGGACLSWREEHALKGFTGLTSLRIARRYFLSDDQVKSIGSCCPHLKILSLAACPSITDDALTTLPLTVTHLKMVCCDRMRGDGIKRFKRLREVRLQGCPGVKETAMQAVLVACVCLQLLEVPGHIRRSALPVGGGSLQGVKILVSSSEK